MDNNKKKKLYNKMYVGSLIGLGLCFVGFVLGGMASVGSGEPILAAVVIPFLGFAFCMFLVPFSYTNSEYYDRQLKRREETERLRNINRIVVVRCTYCGSLNDESAKTCNQCGSKL